MGFRFRRSVSIMPGVRVNLSKSGGSVSIGKRGATVNVGPRGTYADVGIPGSGISYRQKISGAKGKPTGAHYGLGLMLVLFALWAIGHFGAVICH
jgi:hypothetical protein